ncbi:MAG: DUF4340 domain-containing protein [Alphaproteobacteria bacterium]|nr:DUF4340 domain-containing protein [Alphaproteobacteria bacterium]
MTPQTFRKLLVVTVLAAAAALFSVFGRFDSATIEQAGVPMFPGLGDRVGEVTEIHVRDGKGTLTVRRGEKGWALDDKDGYPVRDDRVRTAIIGLAELALNEPKTRLPERYTSLQVEDVEADKSKSVELLLRNEDGNDLANVIIGRRKFSYTDLAEGGIYVRRPGEDQSWFATGEFGARTDPLYWLQTRIIDVPREDVAAMVTVQPDGARLAISKASPDTKLFTVADLPEGAKLRSADAPDHLGAAMDGLDLVDVAPVDEIDFSGDNLAHARAKTFGGLIIDVDMVGKEGKIWARFAASTEAQATAEAARQSQDINARLSGWAFQIKDYQIRNLRMPLKALLKPEGEDDEDDEYEGEFMDLGDFGITPQ